MMTRMGSVKWLYGFSASPSSCIISVSGTARDWPHGGGSTLVKISPVLDRPSLAKYCVESRTKCLLICICAVCLQFCGLGTYLAFCIICNSYFIIKYMCILLEHAHATQTAQKQVLSLWVHLFSQQHSQEQQQQQHTKSRKPLYK